ncbi:MAG: type II toxin-antitoxin system RatA family toxin [Alphaproteobacteria bacterium]|nr:type II toxin-antitoxin system RatA family toxin [Alphaproteobacteria bacterium]NCQ88033.1 type II toxin-antitoxin system RatA family toxin [Alphaproteobacteria bacterium]NCT05460.1 type II toxin-antitoxin system RatA family toxin [Alphaproteobacteria bacterium]
MLSHVEQKTLPYTKQQMFDLVADVGSYNQFAPWCVASRVHKWESDTVFLADLIVGYKVFREKFSSRVILDRVNHDISIEYLKGPLQNLKNHWVFTDGPNGSCIIDFSVEFEFKNKALQGLANMFFNEVVKRMIDAFEARAEEIYGKPA